MSVERRSFVRFRVDVPASLCLYQVDIRYSGGIVDLSLGGCFFPVSGDLPVGESCQIEMTAGEGLTTEQLQLSGVIVRKDGAGFGIQFTDMDPAHKEALEKLLSAASEDEAQLS